MRHVKRSFDVPGQHFFLLGPRGTGKSTLLKKRFKDALVVDLLMPDYFRFLSSKPERLVELVDGHPEKQTIVIDEIQKIPELLTVIHALIERKDGKQYIMTGSSARKLRRQGVNLLGGRALQRSMHPFSAEELGNRFNLNDALVYGLIPVILDSEGHSDALRAYVDLYVREEVMMEGLTRSVGNFSRFLETISFSHGALLNVTSVSRDCQVERKVVESYIGILEDLMIARRLQPFSRRAKRQLTRHRKFYFFDTGIFRELRPSGPLDIPDEIGGAALEGLVLQQLFAWRDNNSVASDIYYWRTKSGSEVDFILYGESVFIAIEVKNSSNVRPNDLTAMKSFLVDYPDARGVLLYRGEKRLLRDNIWIIPCSEFMVDISNHLSQ